MEVGAPKFGLTAFVFVLSTIYHGMGTLFMILVIMSCLDFATGVISAAIQRNLHSRMSFYGIARKLCLLALVPVAIMIDTVLQSTGYVPTTSTFVYHAVTSWLIVTEAISIIENVSKAGAPVPPVILQVLTVMGASPRKGHENDTNNNQRRNN